MYLHLGKNMVVREESVVGIFDLDNSSQSHITREYLARAQKRSEAVNVSEELPKAFVVCEEGGVQTLYLSQLGSATLQKRSTVEGKETEGN